ncbi:MAG: DUF814 domain-containing protein, partial [FCB group bacterium]|nr:DUF814 domain-containing protein [FCB group bacterium]
ETYHVPLLPEKQDPEEVSENDLQNLFDNHPQSNPARLLEKNLYAIDYYLARTLTEDEDTVAEIDPGELHKQLKRIIDAYHTPGSVYAYRLKGKLAYYPVKIAGYEPLGKYRNYSEAQKQVLDDSRESAEADDFQGKTVKALDRKIKKTEKLLVKLAADIEDAADYEKYRQYSDLLKIHLTILKRGMTEITIDDLYNEGRQLTIPLDPKLDGRKNVEQYARRYRKGKDGLALLERRLQNINQELATLKEARESFVTDFEKAQNRWPEHLHRTAGNAPAEVPAAKPYKIYQTSTGLTVFVGKSGDNNDRTTFEYARPYELWFHASQCPGSHLVMKYPHKNFEPSKMEIEEVAACAAHFSKARGAAKVPVSYTLKKYVRKPRKAKAGLVTIERETTILVEPRELQKKE